MFIWNHPRIGKALKTSSVDQTVHIVQNEIADQCDSLNEPGPCLRPAAGRENIDARSLVTIATIDPHHVFAGCSPSSLL
jgi:hypothetical protein